MTKGGTYDTRHGHAALACPPNCGTVHSAKCVQHRGREFIDLTNIDDDDDDDDDDDASTPARPGGMRASD